MTALGWAIGAVAVAVKAAQIRTLLATRTGVIPYVKLTALGLPTGRR